MMGQSDAADFASSGGESGDQQNRPEIVKIAGCFAYAYTSLGELKGASSLIVLGTVKAQTVVYDSHGVPSTLSTLTVERVLKGTVKSGQTVEVKQMGGIGRDGTQGEMEDFPLLIAGTRYLVFLTPSPLPDAYYPVGPQSIYRVQAHGEVSSLDAQIAHMGIPVQNVPIERFIRDIQAAVEIPSQP